MNDIQGKEFVIFDVETTGLSPAEGDRIVEIAALKIKGLVPQEKFYSFVNPEREISFGAFQVNGITPEMLMGAPKSREILPRFFNFLGDAAIVGHNIGFDLGFLCSELSLLGKQLKEETVIVDTLKMARHLLPQLGRYPLWSVATALGIRKSQAHRAMADVELTYEVFRRLVEAKGERSLSEIGVLSHALEKF